MIGVLASYASALAGDRQPRLQDRIAQLLRARSPQQLTMRQIAAELRLGPYERGVRMVLLRLARQGEVLRAKGDAPSGARRSPVWLYWVRS